MSVARWNEFDCQTAGAEKPPVFVRTPVYWFYKYNWVPTQMGTEQLIP